MTLTIFDEADIPQGSDPWLEARRGIVTASTVGKLLTSTGKVAQNDTSRALTETLAAERITGRVEYVHPTADMARGTALEPFARDAYETHHALVHTVGFMTEDRWGYRIGYSPDGIVGDDGLIEIKSRKARIQLRTIRDDAVPLANMAQLQAGLLVSGRQWIDYVSYCPGLPLYVKRVHPSTRWFESIIEAVDLFDQAATGLVDAFKQSAANLPATEYIDPFGIEEEIY